MQSCTYSRSLQRNLLTVDGNRSTGLHLLLTLFLSTLYNFPICLADGNGLDGNIQTLSLADSDIFIVNRSHCGNRPWLTGSDCHCADSLDGIIYCDSSGEVFAKSQFCMSLYGEEEVVGRCPYTYLTYNDPTIDNI